MEDVTVDKSIPWDGIQETQKGSPLKKNYYI